MIVIPELRTDRLLLRAVRASDFPPYAAMCADPDVMRFVSGEPLSAEDAWRQLAMFAGHWTLRGFGTWAVEELSTRQFVGRVGLHYPEGWPDRELGWALARPFWGKGYAAEAGRAALEHAFRALDWEYLVSLIHPANQRSIALATRLGARLAGTVEVRGSSVSLYGYRRTS